MNINIETIPHTEQRYETVGDWWFHIMVDGTEVLEIRVSDMNNHIYEWLVAEHEINEAIMCKWEGIDEKKVTDFDIQFETLRNMHPEIIGVQEPGSMVSAPYYEQHQDAMKIEKLSAVLHKVDWEKYNSTIDNL